MNLVFRTRMAMRLMGLALACQALPLTSHGLQMAEAEALFAHQIWPLINDKCLACHGNEENKLKGDLDLRTRSAALEGGDSGPAFISGNPSGSLLYQAVTWEDEDLQMPPKENERLNQRQLQYLSDWIYAGAPWPSPKRIKELLRSTEDKWSVGGGVRMPTSGGLSEQWTLRKYNPDDLWAYQPIDKPKIPLGINAIDHLLGLKMDSMKVKPASRADRRTLIRRATFNLLGLPPTPAEVEMFVNDPADEDNAFRKVIERLLRNPHYGEHWGQHWLDVVRYADSSGFANDFERGNAWRYRDYVIRSFNADKPYNQFIREQIAGDELEPDNPEMLVSVGFLRMGPWELTGMEVPAIARQRFLDDVVNSVGQTFLGHTLRCAKCHDHKFDPVPTRDFYSMHAVFATTQIADRRAAFVDENLEGFEKEKGYLTARLTRAELHSAKLKKKSREATERWFREHDLPYKTRIEAHKAGIPDDQIPPKHYGYSVEDFGLERVTRKVINRSKWEFERYEPVALSVYNGADPKIDNYGMPLRMPSRPMSGLMEKTYILMGGDTFARDKQVNPGALSVLDEQIPELRRVRFPSTASKRRSALAKWISHPANSLTLRAIVNRVWQWHFNQPIAGNPNNFGGTGKKPTHPELLDWLAREFREQGWSIKNLHRQIMMSEAYRRSSTHPDPETLATRDANGIGYAVFKPRRMTSFELRDSMLAVSGELTRSIGGIPARPEMNWEQALQPRMVMGSFAPAWEANPLPAQRHRRSVYAMKLRGLRDPFMEVFNDPHPDLSCEARDASTVTPQVFSLFNSQISLDRAVAFADRLSREEAEPAAKIQRAVALAYGRPTTAEETAACLNHYQVMLDRHTAKVVPRPDYPREVEREAVEENTGEPFSFTEKLEMMQDFVPDKKYADVSPETRAMAEVCLVLFNSNEFVYIY
ncbi:MAG: hypothetical protein CMO80_18130 [Verrucomicrobiales bacterium]|nr:hypothetical protein [Verrucomicrobiales bacterium]